MINDYIKKVNKIMVLGGGISGYETLKWAIQNNINPILYDQKPLLNLNTKLQEIIIKYNIPHLQEIIDIPKIDIVITSPGIPTNHEIIKKIKAINIPILGEIDLALRFWKGKKIAITGTNGKTTTTYLLGKIFYNASKPHVVAGNIGTPLISLLNDENITKTAILEVSSFQIDYFTKYDNLNAPMFDAAIITNITPDHLDRYTSFENYVNAKLRLLDFLDKNAIISVNEKIYHDYKDKFKDKNVITISSNLNNNPKLIDNKLILNLFNHNYEFNLTNWKLKGKHNIENLSFASSIALSMGIKEDVIQKTIDEFLPPSHRIEFIESVNNIEFYNDSKATNVSSTLKAINSFNCPLVLILGGRGKAEDYTPLKEYIKKTSVKFVILYGEESKRFYETLKNQTPMHIVRHINPDEAFTEIIEVAYNNANPGDVVLFSPACASFDMFNNYEERGNFFKNKVRKFKESIEKNA